MTEKMQAAITSITLNSRTYHNVTVTPTLINFFFGKNGTGKSTIAQQITNGSEVVPDLADYEVLVYDRDFITRNLKEDEGMPGVFSVNEGNIEKQQEITTKESTLSVILFGHKADIKDQK
jgi:adenylylsulfate kinase-like enzyme